MIHQAVVVGQLYLLNHQVEQEEMEQTTESVGYLNYLTLAGPF